VNPKTRQDENDGENDGENNGAHIALHRLNPWGQNPIMEKARSQAQWDAARTRVAIWFKPQ
jgi:hypothetical protein